MSKQLVHSTSPSKSLTSKVGILGVGCLIASLIVLPVYSQTPVARREYHRIYHRAYRTSLNRVRIRPSFRELNPAGRATGNISGYAAYPYGSRVYGNGTVQKPNGQVVSPASTITHNDGSTTFYYPDGSHINTNGSRIPSFGTPITR